MLEKYYVKPETVDRIRASWLGSEIECYVARLSEQGYAHCTVIRRVPMLVRFSEFVRARGATAVEDLPARVDAFVAESVVGRWRPVRDSDDFARQLAKEARGPIEDFLETVLSGFEGSGRPHRRDPFVEEVAGFFDYLDSERGLRPATIRAYRHALHGFEAYLSRIGVRGLEELSPATLSAFVAERAAAGLARTTVRDTCGVLRVFLRYAHREGLLQSDLSMTVEWPQAYRLSTIPRSISWADIGRTLNAVDRRSAHGKRDYAILLLLVTYGLRAREVAALTLDDVDWKHERLAIPERKGRPFNRLPALGVGRERARRLSATRSPADRRSPHVLSSSGADQADRVSGCLLPSHVLSAEVGD
jgi:integrase/recombinase XerD